MIVDASALLAILLDEPEAESFLDAIRSARAPRMSTANWLEVAIRVDRVNRSDVSLAFDMLFKALGIALVAVDVEQAYAARAAFARFGKGRHRAGLNFGDCFAYALAITHDQPLLYKGDDFPHTDVRRAC